MNCAHSRIGQRGREFQLPLDVDTHLPSSGVFHEFPIQDSRQWAKPKGSFNLKDVLPASLIAFGVIAELCRIEAQLLGNKGA